MAVADLVVRIVGNADALSKGLGGAESRINSFGRKVRGAGLAMTAGLTVPILAFAKKSAEAFRESEAAMGQTAAVIKSTGGAANLTARQVGDLASSMQKLTAFEDDAIQQSSNLLLTFTNVRNEVGKGNKIFDDAQLAILNMATAMNKGVSKGADLKGATIQLGKALNDPIKGITALTRVGVKFTDQQKDQIKALVESGDVLGAQKIILAELATEFGGSAKAYADGAGKGEQAANRLADAQERVGAAFDPIRTKGLEKVAGLAEKAAEAFDKLSPGMQEAAGVGLLVVSALGPVATILGQIALIRLPGRIAGRIAGIGTAAGTAAGASGVGGLTTKLGVLGRLLANPFVLTIAPPVGLAVLAHVLNVYRDLENQIAHLPPIAPVITADDSKFKTVAQATGSSILAMTATTATPTIDALPEKANAKLGGVSKRLSDVEAQGAAPVVTLSDLASKPIGGVARKLTDVGGRKPEPRVRLRDEASGGLEGIIGRLGRIVSKTISVTARFFGFGHEGGLVLHAGGLAKMHAGGLKADEVPTILQRGEFVIQKSAVDKLGVPTLARLNRVHDGGMIGVGAGGRGAGGPTVHVHVSGSVIAERDLRDQIQRDLLRMQGRNVTTGIR